MRVALITEGTYPYHASGLSTWCHQLVTGLRDHSYRVVALTAGGGGGGVPPPVFPLPPSATLTTVPVWGPPVTRPGRLSGLRLRRAATEAAVLLCRGLLGDGDPRDRCDGSDHSDHSAALFQDGLARLAQLAAGGTHPLAGTPLADVLADAWRASRGERQALGRSAPQGHGAVGPGGRQALGRSAPQGREAVGLGAAGPSGPGALPRLSLRDAETAAGLLEHALRPLAASLPGVDLCHATSGGLSLLVALAAKWRAGTPYLLTEHGIYLRERYLDYGDAVPAAVREVMLRFFRALSTLGYAQAALVTGASRFDQRWQLRHGAHPARVVVVPGGADPAAYPHRPSEPPDPTVVWVGHIEPLGDLHTLVRAFRRLHGELPAARLRLVGPVADAEYAQECQALVRRLELSEVVEFCGPVRHPGDSYASGQVVARSSVSEGTPYAVIEAMLTGRPTVSTDVGGVAELVGDTGVVVPAGDPVAFADALLGLLRDPARRRGLGEAAAQRARTRFRLDRMLRAYDHLYDDVAESATAVPMEAAR